MTAFDELLVKSYATFTEVELDVTEAARMDGFMVIKRNTERSDEKVVKKGTFCCYKSGVSKSRTGRTAKTDCKFRLHFRMKSATGVYSFTRNHHLTHNHRLNPASTRMSAMARRFTPSQLDTIPSMHAAGISVSQIVAKLKEQTNAVVLNRDVCYVLSRTQKQFYDGLTETQALLSALDGNAEFTCRAEIDNRERLLGIAFACTRSLNQFSKMSFVLLMDATYKTNRFNMPLLLLSSVDPFGQTYIVACCLMRDETAVSYGIALSYFKQLFGQVMPSVNTIITDQETALMNAIAIEFPAASHQLCRWHLQENVKKTSVKTVPSVPNLPSLCIAKMKMSRISFTEAWPRILLARRPPI